MNHNSQTYESQFPNASGHNSTIFDPQSPDASSHNIPMLEEVEIYWVRVELLSWVKEFGNKIIEHSGEIAECC